MVYFGATTRQRFEKETMKALLNALSTEYYRRLEHDGNLRHHQAPKTRKQTAQITNELLQQFSKPMIRGKTDLTSTGEGKVPQRHNAAAMVNAAAGLNQG